MTEQLQQFIETQFGITDEELKVYLSRVAVTLAAILFVLASTVIVAFDSVFIGLGNTTIEIGEVANDAIVAPPTGGSYISEILTEQARNDARNSVQPIFDSASNAVARIWDQRADQTITFINDIRASSRYATQEQQLADLSRMDYLFFEDQNNAVLAIILEDDAWLSMVDEVNNVIEQVYQNRIINAQDYINNQLAIQISPSFDDQTSALIFDIVNDFVRANTFENIEATAAARDAAATAIDPIQRTFAGGQIIVAANDIVEPIDYEVLVAFNMLASQESTIQQLTRAFIASVLTTVIFGLYILRFSPKLLYVQITRLSIVAITFLIVLGFAHLLGVNGNIYLFPAAAMSLLFVAIADTNVSVIATLGLAFLIGLIGNDSLEYTVLIAAGGLIGALGLRQAERLNQFFVAGVLISLVNITIVILFYSPASDSLSDLVTNLAFTTFNGLLLAPATAMAAMFVVTLLFNLPTALKLSDLQQPNKPMLQRLLREAPGTYQHSLQVGNLAEQAANAIGADAQLTRVAALYHDIGKMHNPLYFTENQQELSGNPHDTLNDPYRSADIIITHITEGDEMAKQIGLPQRIRDFIREHHGTTEVYVFYQQALNAVDGDQAAVDIADFTYPGPKPQSQETAILMLADSCEAATRSMKEPTRPAIRDLVATIIESKRKAGQLDESNLTLNDLHIINDIFVDILQGMFHPRVNYQDAIKGKPTPPPQPKVASEPKIEPIANTTNDISSQATSTKTEPKSSKIETQSTRTVKDSKKPSTSTVLRVTTRTDEIVIADDEPLTEVPRLPSLDERRATSLMNTTDVPEPSSDEDDENDDSE